MYTLYDELARARPDELGGRRRWRGRTVPPGEQARDLERAQATRLALARLLYGGHLR